MIIKGIPIGFKCVHIAVFHWLRDIFYLKDKKSDQAKLHFVYFSYKPDFSYLVLSIKSLITNVNHIGSVNVFIDQKAPFDNDEITELKNLSSLIKFHKITNFAWASPSSTLAEFNAFSIIANESNHGDYIVKVDSDILFFRSSKLNKIRQSGLDAVGDGHWDGYEFMQGGLYFIKTEVVEKYLRPITIDVLNTVIEEQLGGNSGEDRCVSQILKNQGIDIYFTHLMLFPSEYQKLTYLNNFCRWDFAAMHFIRDKDRMIEYCEK